MDKLRCYCLLKKNFIKAFAQMITLFCSNIFREITTTEFKHFINIFLKYCEVY